MPIWAVAALLGYGLVLFAPQVLNDGDTYWHLAAGEWMLRHRAVPSVDPFSYTFAGAPWHAHEWLSELVMGIAFRLGGWNGLVMLFGAAAALTLGLLGRHLLRWLDPGPALIALMLAAACIGPSLLARPHLLALPLLELWTAGLLIAGERGRVPWLLLVVMFVWANLHGGFMFGLFLLIPIGLERIVAAGARRRQMAAQWGLFLAGAIAAACLTPWGWSGLAFPFQLLQLKQLAAVGEWQPPSFQGWPPPIELALMAILYVCCSRGVRVPVLRTVILIVLVHLALHHARHQLLAGVVGALVLAGPLGRAFGSATRRERSRAGGTAAVASLFVLGAIVSVFRVVFPVVPTDGPTSPITAFAHVPQRLTEMPVLNDYAFGGYLIFRGVRPFIDSRADLYGDDFLLEYAEMLRPDRSRIERALQARQVRWTMFAAGSPVLQVMDALPGWSRLYADEVAVVHVKD